MYMVTWNDTFNYNVGNKTLKDTQSVLGTSTMKKWGYGKLVIRQITQRMVA